MVICAWNEIIGFCGIMWEFCDFYCLIIIKSIFMTKIHQNLFTRQVLDLRCLFFVNQRSINNIIMTIVIKSDGEKVGNGFVFVSKLFVQTIHRRTHTHTCQRKKESREQFYYHKFCWLSIFFLFFLTNVKLYTLKHKETFIFIMKARYLTCNVTLNYSHFIEQEALSCFISFVLFFVTHPIHSKVKRAVCDYKLCGNCLQ